MQNNQTPKAPVTFAKDWAGFETQTPPESFQKLETTARSEATLVIPGNTEVSEIQRLLSDSPPKAVAIEFETFRNGQGYSLARLLKREPWFQVPLIASGDILVDQIFYLWRCGFDHFILREDQSLELAEAALSSFTHVYQSAERMTP